MSKFWELFEQSVIVSAMLAILVMGTACYAVVNQIPMPDYFAMAFGGVMAYFFSEKTRISEVKRAESQAGPLDRG